MDKYYVLGFFVLLSYLQGQKVVYENKTYELIDNEYWSEGTMVSAYLYPEQKAEIQQLIDNERQKEIQEATQKTTKQSLNKTSLSEKKSTKKKKKRKKYNSKKI